MSFVRIVIRRRRRNTISRGRRGQSVGIILIPTVTATITAIEILFLRIKENKEVYEGEVTELTPEETENPMGGYGKTVAHVIIGLRTTKGVKQLKLDPSIYENLQKEKVGKGA